MPTLCTTYEWSYPTLHRPWIVFETIKLYARIFDEIGLKPDDVTVGLVILLLQLADLDGLIVMVCVQVVVAVRQAEVLVLEVSQLALSQGELLGPHAIALHAVSAKAVELLLRVEAELVEEGDEEVDEEEHGSPYLAVYAA